MHRVAGTGAISRRVALAALGMGALAAAVPARAQTWPDKPVRIIVPFSPGGSIDAFARVLASELQTRFGKPFVVENRPGGAGTLGTQLVARATPDGYTLLVHSSTIASMAQVEKSTFDASSSLTPIALLATAPDVLLVSSSFPVKSVKELIEYSKTHKLLYGSTGVGSTGHLHTEMFNLRAGTNLKHIVYKGVAPALTDLAGGTIQVVFGTIASAQGLIESGKVKVLAYAAEGRRAGNPEAPTIRDSGLNFEAAVWWGFFGPPGMPADLVARLNAETNAAFREPGFVKLLESSGATAIPRSAADFTAAVRKEVADVKEIVESAHITFE
jgi:tripartite-type tricarboxylate transporter receptor subunit TctC